MGGGVWSGMTDVALIRVGENRTQAAQTTDERPQRILEGKIVLKKCTAINQGFSIVVFIRLGVID